MQVSVVSPGLLRTTLHQKAHRAVRQEGYAGDAETQRIYAKAIEAADAAVLGARESPVEIAVDAVVKALTARRPASRYVVGRDGRQLVLLRHLPDRLRDRVLMWNRGLRRELFA